MVDTVAIQGEAGSFSHAAALETYGPNVALVPCATFVDLFRSVEKGRAASGIVPIENTLAGSVHENYDLLSAHPLHVVAEAELRIRHCLIARPSTSRASVRRVASHPVALAQCRRFFTTHPELVAVPSYDTAGSVRDLMAGKVEAEAAIASRLAAQLYGATVLEEGLEDNSENYTRFLVITREAVALPRGKPHKTSLMFTLGAGPGTLHRALGVFAERGLNLTKIESRPLHGRPWEYLFYADVVDTPVSQIDEAIAVLRGVASGVRVLGTYPTR
ncbi:MAG TPA: prephenate dehydratase [Gemmatimonadales bacterium]|nr:prephenate dehydratase [Gemmatimonadales bacterium]